MKKRNYTLYIGNKTKFLNFFRRLFKIPFIENFLVEIYTRGNNRFISKLIPPNYLYKKGSYRTIVRNGIKYKLDISNVVDHLTYFGFQDNCYDSVIKNIKSSEIILDIGANIGTTALFFAKKNPNAEIIAFEPHPDTFLRLQGNINNNKPNKIKIQEIGIGKKKNTLKLYEVNQTNPGMNRIICDNKDFPFKWIKITSIDNFVSENNIKNIDFIKIDVEGHEYDALIGGNKIIQRTKPIIFLELDDNNLKENNSCAKDVITFLYSMGYKYIYRADTNNTVNTQTDFTNCHFDIIAK